RMSIDSAGQNKAVTLINIFRIISFKIEFNKFYIIFEVTGGEPIPVILKICFRKTDTNFFLHELKCFAVQISEIFTAYGFWIIGVRKVGDSEISQCFNMFLFHSNITEPMGNVYF